MKNAADERDRAPLAPSMNRRGLAGLALGLTSLALVGKAEGGKNGRRRRRRKRPGSGDSGYALIRSWGSEGRGRGQFRSPHGVAWNGSQLFVADIGGARIQAFLPNGDFVSEFHEAGFAPIELAFAPDGRLLVSDVATFQIQRFDVATWTRVSRWGGGKGNGPGQFQDGPAGVAADAAGNVYVADVGNHRVQKFAPDGRFLSAIGAKGEGPGQFDNPQGIAFDRAGNLFVCDFDNYRIQKFNASGGFVAAWGSHGIGNDQFDHPGGVATDRDGNVYVSDLNNKRVQKFTNDGRFIGSVGNGGRGRDLFDLPWGVTVDDSGNVFVADIGKCNVQVFAPR